jgi:hypothetical protein
MHRINYIVFLLVFIVQQSLAGSLNDLEYTNKAKLINVKKKEMQNIPSANTLRIQALLKESKIRLKLALPLLIAGLAEFYVNVSFNNNMASKLESCEQAMNVNNFISCEQARNMNSRNKNNETNVILSFLPFYLLIDIVLSSSFIANKTLYNYIAEPMLFISDVYFNGLAYLYLFVHSNSVSKYVPLSNFISLYTIIGGLSNLWYRSKERSGAERKIAEHQININNALVQAPADIHLVDQ